MSIMIGEAIENVVSDLAAGVSHPLRKRVTRDMIGFYRRKGWTLERYDENGNGMMIWLGNGAPP